MDQSLTDFAYQLAMTDTSTFIRDVSWIIPLVQTIHIIALAIVFSSGAIFALASLGLIRTGWSLGQWVGRLYRWMWVSLGVLLVSGVILIVGEPERSMLNPIFQLKMLLLIGALAATIRLAGRVRQADRVAGQPVAVVDGQSRILAIVALLLWVGIMSAGRWIAYYTDF
jgi:hypothetical protein